MWMNPRLLLLPVNDTWIPGILFSIGILGYEVRHICGEILGKIRSSSRSSGMDNHLLDLSSEQIPVRTLLVFISGGTLIGMSAYEIGKELYLPGISKWESHLITIAVTVILVTVLTYYILQKQNALQAQIIETKREAESAYRHLASIIESSDDAILSIDSTGNIISFNPAAERIFEKSAGMILNHPVSELIPPEIPDRTADLIRMVGGGRTIRHDEGVFLRSDGSRIHLSIIAAPLPDNEKYPGSVSVIARDISDHIAREEMLKMLTLKQQLLTAITRHDIKNNLQILMGFCTLLEEKVSDPDISRIVSIIQEQSGNIHNQVLFMEAYQSLGTNPPTWLKADELFFRSISPFKKERELFQVSLADLEVYADPLIEKVIYNLCDNALRYGGELSFIRTFWTLKGDVCIWVVEDDGIGVQSDLKEKIFENGFGQTTGFGLFLAREILSITNIRIMETGLPSEGARFEMIVPAGFWRLSSP